MAELVKICGPTISAASSTKCKDKLWSAFASHLRLFLFLCLELVDISINNLILEIMKRAQKRLFTTKTLHIYHWMPVSHSLDLMSQNLRELGCRFQTVCIIHWLKTCMQTSHVFRFRTLTNSYWFLCHIVHTTRSLSLLRCHGRGCTTVAQLYLAVRSGRLVTSL
jgi:hypothetical protein